MPSLCDDGNGASHYGTQQVGLGDLGRAEPQQQLGDVGVAHDSSKQLAIPPSEKKMRQLPSDTRLCFRCIIPVVLRINTDCRDLLAINSDRGR